MSETNLKAIFKQALEQSALGEIQFTLRIAEQRMRDFHLPEQTVAVMREMRARELALTGVKGTKAMQTESLRLVQRYRASIPGYASSFKRVSFPVGLRKDGSRKWVSHRTLLRQRLTPLSIMDVQALIQPEPVAAPAPVKRAAKAKPQSAAPIAPQPCPACAARVHARATNPKSKFGCPVCWKQRLTQTGPTTHTCLNCGLVAIVNTGDAF